MWRSLFESVALQCNVEYLRNILLAYSCHTLSILKQLAKSLPTAWDSAFSPSRRTASPLVTDCESEACELRARINQTECLLPMDLYSADGTNTKTQRNIPPFLPFPLGSPLCKGAEPWEGEICSPSRLPPVFIFEPSRH